MKLQQEVRHKSEDVDDTVLLDVAQAIRRRVRIVSRDCDIPYIAGYSTDGHTISINRHLPKSFRWLTKTVRVDPFLLTHEVVEKALLDELRCTTSTLIRAPFAPNAMRSRRQACRGLSINVS